MPISCLSLVIPHFLIDSTAATWFNFVKMSRMISVVGDDNVRRNMTGLNLASREAMKSSQVIDCSNLASLDAALDSVRSDSTVCIVACITEFLVASGDCGTIFSTIDPILATFTQKLHDFCSRRQTTRVNNLLPLANLMVHATVSPPARFDAFSQF